jgi:uncharacterized protein (TIGR02058 family)
MEKIFFVEIGTGIDQHGQDITVAAIRAVEDAIRCNAMPGLKSVLPENDFNRMRIHVRLALPCDKDKLEVERVRRALPYGQVTMEVIDGGMVTRCYTVLPEKGDKNDLVYVVNAAVEVGY